VGGVDPGLTQFYINRNKVDPDDQSGAIMQLIEGVQGQYSYTGVIEPQVDYITGLIYPAEGVSLDKITNIKINGSSDSITTATTEDYLIVNGFSPYMYPRVITFDTEDEDGNVLNYTITLNEVGADPQIETVQISDGEYAYPIMNFEQGTYYGFSKLNDNVTSATITINLAPGVTALSAEITDGLGTIDSAVQVEDVYTISVSSIAFSNDGELVLKVKTKDTNNLEITYFLTYEKLIQPRLSEYNYSEDGGTTWGTAVQTVDGTDSYDIDNLTSQDVIVALVPAQDVSFNAEAFSVSGAGTIGAITYDQGNALVPITGINATTQLDLQVYNDNNFRNYHIFLNPQQ
jgi:hypothetical protein